MLGYCTNVHRGNTFRDVLHTIETICKPICMSTEKPVGAGLWLSNQAANEVDIHQLKDTLDSCHVSVFTMNGFPFSDFHSDVVKHAVYKPNWCNPTRLDYTLKLASILAEVVDGNEAGISTVPLGWDTDSFHNEDAAKLLQQCVLKLAELEQDTGVCIHLDIETEPGCRLQRSSDVMNFVNEHFGDDEQLRRHLRVCHDTCHAAVMHESAQEAIANYQQAGLSIGKVQLSSAIEVNFNVEGKTEHVNNLRLLAEPRYLHQTTILDKQQLTFHENLADVSLKNPSGLWRVHFHVPIHQTHIGSLQTTQSDLQQSIPLLAEAGATHWEVETYTWNVMPTELRTGELIESISKELEWAGEQIYA